MDDNQRAIAEEQADIKALLERETADGPGDLANLPKSDFKSFAEKDVEEKA